MQRPTLSLLALALASAPLCATASDGTVDPAYGTGGRTAIGFLESHSVVLRGYDRSSSTGNIWMVGDDRNEPGAIYISRLLPDGQPDPGFGVGADGRRRTWLPAALIPQAEAIDIAGVWVQPDGKPVVYGGLRSIGTDTGVFPAVVCRLAAAGNYDPGYGESGSGCRTIRTWQGEDETCRVTDVAATHDNSGMLVIGHCQASGDPQRAFIGRLTPSGAIDLEFGAGVGIVTPPMDIDVVEQRFRALAVRPNGLAVVSGDVLLVEQSEFVHRDLAVWQFDGGGSLDVPFGNGGVTRIDFPVGGKRDSEGRDVVLRPDGSALVLGQATLSATNRRAALLAQLTPTGALDTTFGEGGRKVDMPDAGFGAASAFNALALDDRGYAFVGGARVDGMPAAVNHAGTRFRFAYPKVVTEELSDQFRLLVAGPTATTGTVTLPSENMTIPFSVTPGTPTHIDLPPEIHGPILNDAITQHSIQIVTAAPVVVHALAGRSFAIDGATILPDDRLGTNYRVMSWRQGLGLGSTFTIVATESGPTTVRIVPSVTTAGHPAGQPYEKSLFPGEIYRLHSTAAEGDLTGTTIQANRPVAVLAGHTCAQVPDADTDLCDPVFEQLEPIERWGRDFIVAPTAGRPAGTLLRVLAHESGTVLSIDGSGVALLSAGETYDLVHTQALTLHASKPVAVAQLALGSALDSQGHNHWPGDPFLVNVPPVSAWNTQYLAVIPDKPIATSVGDYTRLLHIVAPLSAAAQVTLNEGPVGISNFEPIGNSGYAFARLSRLPGEYRVAAPVPISVAIHAHGHAESYAYPAAAMPPSGTSGTPATPPALADDAILRYRPDGARDVHFGSNGIARIDHTAHYEAGQPSVDGVLRLVFHRNHLMVGSDSRNADSGQPLMMSYRLRAADLFRDGFED